ncbi:DNA mismatch repair protein MutS type 2 [Zea mays]|uniref:DNA mismatch repair protein MutS type 2 n=1 Tax=Zea mays TaxID=4577 RepID=A0A1D6GN38_MAIZE|nr:DNA mismatch repair protein MutS type 2 [Zea mays]
MLRLSIAVLTSPLLPTSVPAVRPHPRRLLRLRLRSLAASSSLSPSARSLRLLEWGKVCDAVASFAGTAHGRDATTVPRSDIPGCHFSLPEYRRRGLFVSDTSAVRFDMRVQKQLWEVEDVSYEQSQMLLQETEAAVLLLDNAGGAMDFSGLDTVAIESAIHSVSGGAVIKGLEAMAVTSLMMFVESLQVNIKAAMKLDEGSCSRLTTLTETILDAVINKSLVKSIQDIVDDDGSVKDTASPELRRYREQVQRLENRLYQLMDKLMRNADDEASLSEVCIVNGRCCIRTTMDNSSFFDGLLLSRSDAGSMIEPIVAVPLNDELQESRALVAKAELDVLSKLTDKIRLDLDSIQNLLQETIKLDKIAARAKYSIAYDGTFPDLYLPNFENETVTSATGGSIKQISSAQLPKKAWKLYMPNAYHPLLLQRHQENIHRAKRDVASATAEIRRRRIYGQDIAEEDQLASDLDSMKLRVSQLEKDQPVPVDFMIAEETTVLVITGPNTGGKTISLKTVGLASLMAKIGNGAIRAESTSESLVLLDEVGAGTNPLEGAALGMSLLESFAEAGSFLTLATTHHGELKTLKYSNNSFENACMEFDEENLKPTFKILWGIPGRSNAINITERLGLPLDIVESSRRLLGTAGAEINALIMDMERLKQEYQQHLQEAQYLLMQSKELHNNLELAQKSIVDHTSAQRKRKARVISEYAVMARSIIRKKFQQFQESAIAERVKEEENAVNDAKSDRVKDPMPANTSAIGNIQNIDTSLGMTANDDEDEVPEVGDSVYVPKLKNEATVVKIDSSKNEVQVQAGMMKLKLKLKDVKVQKRKVSR